MKKQFIILLILLPVLFTSCSEAFKDMKNKTLQGSLFRNLDHQKLSDVQLYMKDDSVFIYSNAIFGADNDTLILENPNEKDSTFTFKNPKGTDFTFKIWTEFTDDKTPMYFIGNQDFYMLFIKPNEISKNEVPDFYFNKSVPINPSYYLFGTYKGEIEPNNQLVNIFFFGPIKVKMRFMENFKVKLYFNSVLSDIFSSGNSPNYELVEYSIKGNKLYLKRNKSKINEIEILNQGEKLAVSTDELDLVMYKVK